MKWCTKSHELGLFLITLLLVVDGIRCDEKTRIDAEQDSYETMTLADDGGVSSALFGSCLAASRALQIKFYSIEITGTTNEFIRYVPDSLQLVIPPEWITVASNPSVAKFTDCAEAAHRMGYPMFKYSGGTDCKVSNRSYDLGYTPACEGVTNEAVFISSSAVVGCPLPGVQFVIDDTHSVCVSAHTGSMNVTEAFSFCQNRHGLPFSGPRGLLKFEDIVKLLKALKVESSNFFVNTYVGGENEWKWSSDDSNIPLALFLQAPPRTGSYTNYMNGSAGFMLDFAQTDTYRGGVVCSVPVGS